MESEAQPPPLQKLDPPPGTVWHELHQRNLLYNALSLGGELLTRAEFRRLSEGNRQLQGRLLPLLVDDVRRKVGLEYECTRLHCAAFFDRVERAEALLAAGVDPTALSDCGLSALGVSVMDSERGAVGLLLVRKTAAVPLLQLQEEADHNEVLHLAAGRGQTEVVAALLERGLEPDVRKSIACTPLHFAARGGHVPVMELLLGAGAEVDATDHCVDETPLQWAAKDGKLDAARLLLDRGADANRRAGAGATAFFLACRRGHLEVAQLLHSRGADPRLAWKRGTTPLAIARTRGHGAVVAWLEALLGGS